MPVVIKRFNDPLRAAERLKKSLEEQAKAVGVDIDIDIAQQLRRGEKEGVQLIINGTAIDIEGEVASQFGPSFAISYGPGGHLGIARWGLRVKTNEEGEIEQGELYDPFSLTARVIAEGVKRGMSPVEALVAGVDDYPSPVTGAYRATPTSGITATASSVAISGPSSIGVNTLLSYVYNTPDLFRPVGGLSEKQRDKIFRTITTQHAYRQVEFGKQTQFITLSPFYFPRGSASKSVKGATLGRRETALSFYVEKDDEGRPILREPQTEELSVRFPWETQRREVPAYGLYDQTMSVLWTPMPFRPGGAVVRASTLRRPGEWFGLPKTERIDIEGIESAADLLSAFRNTNIVEGFSKARGRLWAPGSRVEVGEFGGAKIVLTNPKTQFSFFDLGIEVPAYVHVSGRFALPSEAFEEGPDGQKRMKPEYMRTVDYLQKHLGKLPEGLKIYETADKRVSAIAHGAFAVDASFKFFSKAGVDPVGSMTLQVGEQKMPLDLATGEVKKPALLFWAHAEGTLRKARNLIGGARGPVLDLQKAIETGKYTEEEVRVIRQAAGLWNLISSTPELTQAFASVGRFKPVRDTNGETLLVPLDIDLAKMRYIDAKTGEQKGFMGDYAASVIAEHALDRIRSEVLSAAPEERAAIAARQIEQYGMAFVPSGRIIGLPEQQPETLRLFGESATAAGSQSAYDAMTDKEGLPVRGGYLFQNVTRELTPEYYGAATLNLQGLYGLLSMGDAGHIVLRSLGIDPTPQGLLNLMMDVRGRETPGIAGWRDLLSGALTMGAGQYGLEANNIAVSEIDREMLIQMQAAAGSAESEQEQLQNMEEYLREQGIGGRLLKYGDVVLPRPRSILGISAYTEEGKSIGRIHREYMDLLSNLSISEDSETTRRAATTFYNRMIDKLSGKRIARTVGIETARGFSARYDVSSFLKPNEVYVPSQFLKHMIINYGYKPRDVRRVLRAINKSKYGAYMAVIREPNPAAKPLIARLVSPQEMWRRVYDQTLSGVLKQAGYSGLDEITSKEERLRLIAEARKQTAEVMNAMRLSPKVGWGLAIRGAGDLDKDLFTGFLVLPERARSMRELRRKLDEMGMVLQRESVGSASSISALLGDIQPGTIGWYAEAINELQKSAEDYEGDVQSIHKRQELAKEFTPVEMEAANIETAESKSAMASTYNARRSLLFAMSESGLPDWLTRSVFEGTTAAYQYALDLGAERGASFVERLTTVFANMGRARGVGAARTENARMSTPDVSIDEVMLEAATMASEGNVYKAFQGIAQFVHSRVAGSLARDVSKRQSTVSPEAAVGLLLGGTDLLPDEKALEERAGKIHEILSEAAQNNLSEEEVQKRLTRLFGSWSEEVAQTGQAIKTPIFTTMLTAAMERVLDPRTSSAPEKQAERAEAIMNILGQLAEDKEGQDVFARAAGAAAVSLIQKGAYSAPLAYIVARNLERGNIGMLGRLFLGSIGISGVTDALSDKRLNHGLAPRYAVRELAAMMSGEGRSDYARAALRTFVARHGIDVSPSKLIEQSTEAMELGKQGEVEAIRQMETGEAEGAPFLLANDVMVSGTLGGVAVSGRIDWIGLRPDEEGNLSRVVIGDVKTTTMSGEELVGSRQYGFQLWLYKRLLQQTASDDEKWSRFVAESGIAEGFDEETRETVLNELRQRLASGDVSLELARHGVIISEGEGGERTRELSGDITFHQINVSDEEAERLLERSLREMEGTPTPELARAVDEWIEQNKRSITRISPGLRSMLQYAIKTGGESRVVDILRRTGLGAHVAEDTLQKAVEEARQSAGEVEKERAEVLRSALAGAGGGGKGGGGKAPPAPPPPDDKGPDDAGKRVTGDLSEVAKSIRDLREGLKDLTNILKDLPQEIGDAVKQQRFPHDIYAETGSRRASAKLLVDKTKMAMEAAERLPEDVGLDVLKEAGLGGIADLESEETARKTLRVKPHAIVEAVWNRIVRGEKVPEKLLQSEAFGQLVEGLAGITQSSIDTFYSEALRARNRGESHRDALIRAGISPELVDETAGVLYGMAYTGEDAKRLGAGAHVIAKRGLMPIIREARKLRSARYRRILSAATSPDLASVASEMFGEEGVVRQFLEVFKGEDEEIPSSEEEAAIKATQLLTHIAISGESVTPEQFAKFRKLHSTLSKFAKTRMYKDISAMSDEEWEKALASIEDEGTRQSLRLWRATAMAMPSPDVLSMAEAVVPHETKLAYAQASKIMGDYVRNLERLNDVTKRATEEIGKHGKVTRETREELKAAMLESRRREIDVELAKAQAEASKYKALAYDEDGNVVDMGAAEKYAGAMARANKLYTQRAILEKTIDKDVERIVGETESAMRYPYGSPQQGISQFMRSMFGGFGLFYMRHLFNIPVQSMATGFAEHEQALEAAGRGVVSAYRGFLPSQIPTYTAMTAALRRRGAAPYGPVRYGIDRILDWGMPTTALLGGMSAAAFTNWVGPSLLRAAQVIPGVTGMIEAAGGVGALAATASVPLAIAAAVGAGALYAYGVKTSPMSPYTSAMTVLRQDTTIREQIDASLYGRKEATKNAVTYLMAMAGEARLTPEQAQGFLAAGLPLSDEEAAKWDKSTIGMYNMLMQGWLSGGTSVQSIMKAFDVKAPTASKYTRTTVSIGLTTYPALQETGTLSSPLMEPTQYSVEEITPEWQEAVRLTTQRALQYAQALSSGLPAPGIASLLTGKPTSAYSWQSIEVYKAIQQRFGQSPETLELLSSIGYKRFLQLPQEYIEAAGLSMSGLPHGATPDLSRALDLMQGLAEAGPYQYQAFSLYTKELETLAQLGVKPESVKGIGDFSGATPLSIQQQLIDLQRLTRAQGLQGQFALRFGVSAAMAGSIAYQAYRGGYTTALQGAVSMSPIGLTYMAQKGALPSVFQLADVNMQGQITGLPLGTTSLNIAGMSPEEWATAVWGENWATDTVLGKYMVEGYETPYGTFYGERAAQWWMSDMRYKAQMASIGNAYARAMLQYRYTTGRGAPGPAFSWSIPGLGSYNGGKGFWGYERAMFELGVAQTQWQFGMRERQMALQEEMWRSNYSLNLRQFNAQWEYTQNAWNLQDQQRALQWSWRVQDIRENMMFASGRQRRLLDRQLSRETVMHNLQEEQVENARNYQETLMRLQKERFDEEKRFHEEQKRMRKESFEMEKKIFEERTRLQRQYFELQHKYFLEQHKLQLQAIGAQAYYAQELHKANQELMAHKQKMQDVTSAMGGSMQLFDGLTKAWYDFMNGVRESLGLGPISPPKPSHKGGFGGSYGGRSVGKDNDPMRAQEHVGGVMAPHVPYTLREGEVVVISGGVARAISPENEQSGSMLDRFAVGYNDSSTPTVAANINVTIGTDDLRQIVRQVIAEELTSVGE